MKTKLMIVVLTLSMLSASLPPCAVGAEDYARVEYTDAGGSYDVNNWSAVNAAVKTDAEVEFTPVEAGGERGLRITPNKTTGASCINIGIDDGFMNNLQGDGVDVTVRYFDSGTGKFLLQYDGRMNDNKAWSVSETEIVYLENTQVWKEHTFKLYDARLDNNLGRGTDLRLNLYSEKLGFPKESVIIQSVTIRRSGKAFPINMDINGPAGNVFLKGSEAQLYLTAENISRSNLNLDCKMTITDAFGGERIVDKNVRLVPGKNALIIPTAVTECGTYDVNMKFTNGAEIYGEYNTNFSISVNASSENESYGMNTHYRLTDRNPYISRPLMREMGAGWSRESLFWSQCEKSAGRVYIPMHITESIEVGLQNGIKTLVVLTGGNSLYDNNRFPQSDEAIAAFGNYVYEVVRALKGKADTFQLWNEFHHTWNGMHPDYASNPRSVVWDTEYTAQGAEAYVKLLKVVYERAKEANPECKIVGFGGVPSIWPHWIEKMLDVGVGDYSDYISLHEYNSSNPPEKNLLAYLKRLVGIVEEKGASDLPIWITETGWSTYDLPQSEQAKYAVREYLLLKDIGIDKIFWYDFKNDGVNHSDAEMSYGAIYNHAEKEKAAYSARPLYVALANMNDKIGEAEIKEHITTDDGTEVFKLKSDFGGDVCVLWNLSGSTTATVDFGSAEAELYDMFGNMTSLESESGVYTVEVSDAPVYITKKDFEKKYEVTKIDYNTNEITVRVDDIYSDDTATMLVLNPGKTVADIYQKGSGAVCYIDQLTGTDGIYEFTFKADKNGEYGIYVYNGKQIVRLGAEFHKTHGAEVSISQSGVPVTDFGGIDKSKPLTVKAIIENNGESTAEYMFVCALYADGRLTDCFMNNENLGAGKHSLEQEITAKADSDEIKVFVWRDKTRLIPIADGLYLSEKASGASE